MASAMSGLTECHTVIGAIITCFPTLFTFSLSIGYASTELDMSKESVFRSVLTEQLPYSYVEMD